LLRVDATKLQQVIIEGNKKVFSLMEVLTLENKKGDEPSSDIPADGASCMMSGPYDMGYPRG
jgi:hypothetical protein